MGQKVRYYVLMTCLKLPDGTSETTSGKMTGLIIKHSLAGFVDTGETTKQDCIEPPLPFEKPLTTIHQLSCVCVYNDYVMLLGLVTHCFFVDF